MNLILPNIPPLFVTTLYILLFVSLLLLLIIVFYFLIITVKEHLHNRIPEKKAEVLVQNAYEEAMRIMDSARVKSVRLLSNSQFEAQKALGEASDLSADVRDILKKKVDQMYQKQESNLKQLGEELAKSYSEAVMEEKNENIRTLAETTSAIKNEVLLDIDEFKEVIRKETVESKKAVEEKLRQSYEDVEKEISEYREQKIKALNEKVFLILADLTEKLIGRSLDQTEHEKIIISTLKDEIKKLGLSNESPINNKN